MTLKDFIFDIPWIFIGVRSLMQSGFKKEKKIIRENVPRDAKVLDFGCGTGQYAVLFDENSYYGVDIKGPSLEYAKRTFSNKTFLHFDDDFRVSLASDSFDWIICSAVIHHIPPSGETRFKSEIVRLLNKDGKILIIDIFPNAHQRTTLGRFLVSADRGKYPRMPEQTVRLFGEKMKSEKMQVIKAGPYLMYVLVLKKSEC